MATRGEITHSDFGNAEALVDNLETQFQPMSDPTALSVEVADVTLSSYVLAPSKEENVSNRDEVQEAIAVLKESRAQCTNSNPKGN
jgi:hypothetical protein